MEKEFNEIEWIQGYINKRIDISSLDNIRNFSLFWNVFESTVCRNQANANSICSKVDELVNKRNFNFQDYRESYDYFKNRYTTSGKVNYEFNSLGFKRPDKKELVQEVLESDNPSKQNIIKALLIIVYRLRNNLFHGKKSMKALNSQIDNFKITNKLLAMVIEQYDES